MKELPIFYMKKDDCCGCNAFYSICPKRAIIMEADEEGFEYPNINSDKCVRCFQCVSVCPMKKQNLH